MINERYLYQSPYNSKVQYGRLDPSVANEQKTQNDLSSINQVTNTSVQKAESFAQTQQSEVTPTVTPNKLDVYA
jgi:hypothetical protein